MSDPAIPSEENRLLQTTLLDQVLEPANIQRAWERVRAKPSATNGTKVLRTDKAARRFEERIRDGAKRSWTASGSPKGGEAIKSPLAAKAFP